MVVGGSVSDSARRTVLRDMPSRAAIPFNRLALGAGPVDLRPTRQRSPARLSIEVMDHCSPVAQAPATPVVNMCQRCVATLPTPTRQPAEHCMTSALSALDGVASGPVADHVVERLSPTAPPGKVIGTTSNNPKGRPMSQSNADASSRPSPQPMPATRRFVALYDDDMTWAGFTVEGTQRVYTKGEF